MKVSKEEALSVIISTPTGKAISQDNPTYLYDQPTSNLSAIVSELPKEIHVHFTKQNIIKAANFAYYSAPCKVAASPELKTTQKEKMKRCKVSASPRLKGIQRVKLKQHHASLLQKHTASVPTTNKGG